MANQALMLANNLRHKVAVPVARASQMRLMALAAQSFRLIIGRMQPPGNPPAHAIPHPGQRGPCQYDTSVILNTCAHLMVLDDDTEEGTAVSAMHGSEPHDSV
jgi:hypothetical protein